MTDSIPESTHLLSQFVFERLLNQDNQGRRIILLGNIASSQSDPTQALLLVERAAFSTSTEHLNTFISSLNSITSLGDNDIYKWYLANYRPLPVQPTPPVEETNTHDLKITLIHPCTSKHIDKYTPAILRTVVETPDIYSQHVKPWIEKQRDEGRLNWVYNIIDGKTEVEDVIYRSDSPQSQSQSQSRESGNEKDKNVDEGFLLLPDLEWDRKTLFTLRLLCIVTRRDKFSVRDLTRRDVSWLKAMVDQIGKVVEEMYGREKYEAKGLDRNMLKFYIHYQPTYYHLHIHVASTSYDAGMTQAVGKAMDLRNVISILENMRGDDDDDASMAKLDLTYTISENTELWKNIWKPMKGMKQ